MKVFTHNFNPNSNSGPNKFTRTLFNKLIKDKNLVLCNQHEADVEFCLIQQQAHKVKPMVLRLDGIWFNSEQEYDKQNAPIKFAYKNADAVVFQSKFNKMLTEKWFGKHNNSHIIHNAADSALISRIDKNYWNSKFGINVEVWTCASNWRPHKRLKENVRYFLEFAPKDAVLAIAGKLPIDEAREILAKDDRIYFLGELDYVSLLSLYRRSNTFIHLAYLDHCPNVVVDAQAAGCKVICSSSGGTSEIVNRGKVIIEDDWDFTPIALYNPPEINFKNSFDRDFNAENTFEKCVNTYYNVLNEVIT